MSGTQRSDNLNLLEGLAVIRGSAMPEIAIGTGDESSAIRGNMSGMNKQGDAGRIGCGGNRSIGRNSHFFQRRRPNLVQ